ncbi:restriction endonuclease [Pseudarthrobacter sp. MDT3-1]
MVDSKGLSREYESAVADVVGFLAGGEVTVERDVYLPGRQSDTPRQIDILVRGPMFGLSEATLVIDCKRYSKKLDVNDVGQFAQALADVGAVAGWIVSTKGASRAAQQLASRQRGIRTEIMSIEELLGWSPPGTRHVTLGVPQAHLDRALVITRKAGFRVTRDASPQEKAATEGEILLNAYRHYGMQEHEKHRQDCTDLVRRLEAGGITPLREIGNGVVAAGGTPAHRWLSVTRHGADLGVKVLAATESDIQRELDSIAQFWDDDSFVRAGLDVVRPEPWPIPGLFQERIRSSG